ncbi:MAG: hypothetical protein J6Y13_06325 [Treponema sp.]|nr:hypothetical protein [Treponema sp.]
MNDSKKAFVSSATAAALFTMALVFSLASCTSTGFGHSAANTPDKIDMTAWHYNAADDVYYQTGLSYTATPADERYETMGIFIPGAYMNGTENEDGSYTLTVNKKGSISGYTAQTAPFIMPIETPGYAAANPPAGYNSTVKTYTDAGYIYIWSGARGREHGAPSGVTDYKAAIRYTRYNKDRLPGNTAAFFSYGMSGGGAQSVLLGATGDSALYTPYLEAIGAVMNESDAIMGSQSWCPITNLNIADEAYEWEMGVTRTGLTIDMRSLSNRLGAAFAAYINELGLTDERGTVLTLTQSADSLYHAGSYYDYLKTTIENSLNAFLAGTSFPYTPGVRPERTGSGNPGSNPNGNPGATTGSGQSSNPYKVPLNTTYATAEDYIAALNAKGKWVAYDSSANTVKISSIEAFMRAVKNAAKSVGAFDDLNRAQGENILFGFGDGKGVHFDPIEADLLKETDYEAAFTEDLGKTDALGKSISIRADMYNPMYFLCRYYKGYKKSTPAKYWRIRSGIFQGDTALSTETTLALALKAYGPGVKSVDFETIWGQGHTEAERTGSPHENFIAWVNLCMH